MCCPAHRVEGASQLADGDAEVDDDLDVAQKLFDIGGNTQTPDRRRVRRELTHVATGHVIALAIHRSHQARLRIVIQDRGDALPHATCRPVYRNLRTMETEWQMR